MGKNIFSGSPLKGTLFITAFGFDLALCLLLGFLLGRWVDKTFGFGSVSIMLCMLLGLVGGVVNIILLLKHLSEDADG